MLGNAMASFQYVYSLILRAECTTLAPVTIVPVVNPMWNVTPTLTLILILILTLPQTKDGGWKEVGT